MSNSGQQSADSGNMRLMGYIGHMGMGLMGHMRLMGMGRIGPMRRMKERVL